jgi:hypothetical protein
MSGEQIARWLGRQTFEPSKMGSFMIVQLRQPCFIAVIALSLIGFGCGEKKAAKVATNSGKAKNENGSELNQGEGNPENTEDPMNSVEGAFLDAEYSVDANVIGMGICNGEANIKIDPILGAKTGQMLVIEGGMSCMGMQIDLGAMMAGAGGAAPPKVKAKNGVMGFSTLGPVTFIPSRPLFPLFLALKPKELASLSVSKDIKLSNSASGEAGSGSISLTVTETDMDYTPPGMVKKFQKAIRYNTVVSGFDTVKDKFSNFLFDEIEMVISLKPIAIPYVKFQGKVADAMEAGKNMPGGGGGDMLGGLLGAGGGGGGALGGLGALIPILTNLIDVKVELNLTSMEGIEDTSFDKDEFEGDDDDDDDDDDDE